MTVKLDLLKVLDSTELVQSYQQLRLLCGDELALELVKILKSIDFLKRQNESLWRELGSLRIQADCRPREEQEPVW